MKVFTKILYWFHQGISFLPLISWCLFMLYVFKVTLLFGSFPEPDNPDPKILNQPLFREIVYFSFGGCFLSMIIWPLLMFLSRGFDLYKLDKIRIWSWVIGIFLVSLILLGNIFKLRTWFAD